MPTRICGTLTVLKWIYAAYLLGRQVMLSAVAQVPGTNTQESMPVLILLTDVCSLIFASHLLSPEICLHLVVFRKTLEDMLAGSLSKTHILVLYWREVASSWTAQRAMMGTVEKEGVEKSAVSHWCCHWYPGIWSSHVLKNTLSPCCLHTLSWSSRIDLFAHFILDPLRLSGHSVLVFLLFT